ncbi:MAG TPA: heme exporter protein CcmB [Xanthomonadales bacterium]|nr:heme exporter protein CcmB [Xanthomonadales bacterium]
MSALTGFNTILRRDLLIAVRKGPEVLMPLAFLLVVVSLFPLGIGPGPALLERMGGGVIWISALLATVISLDTLFRSDFEDGSLDQLLTSGIPASVIALAKITAYWLVTGLPIVLLSPLLALWMNVPTDTWGILMVSLALGTPVLSLLGAVAAALTLGLKRGGQFLALLVFPLYVPVLITGTGAVMAASDRLPYTPFLGLLLAGLLVSLAVMPLATGAALRISVS